jgi:hypothetical protein
MPDGIKRPVTLSSEAFTSMRVTDVPQPVTPMGGGVASRVEHVIGHRHEFTDADGHWVATAYCEPEVAQIMLAALNAADPRAALQAMTDVEGPTAEEAVEDCRAAQRALGDFTATDPHGLWLRCSCGHDIDVLQAVVDNSAAEVEEDGKRRFQGVGALVTFLRCPACGKRTALGYEEVTGEVTVTDPRGREVHIPVRSGDSAQAGADVETLTALASAAGDTKALGRVAAEAAANRGFTLDPGDAEELAKAVAAAMLARLLTLAAADLPAPDTWFSECIMRGYDRRTTAEYQAWLDMRERIAAAAASMREQIKRLQAERDALTSEVLALLREIRRLQTEEWSGNPNWRAGNEHTYAGQRDMIAERALARPLPDAAKRAEAEHDLAVAYLAERAAQAEWAAVWNRLKEEGRMAGDPIHGMFVRDGDDEGRRLVSEATARWEAAKARLDQAGQTLRALDGDPRV